MIKMNYFFTSTLVLVLFFLDIPFPRNVVVVEERVVRKARLTLVSFATVWEDGGHGGWASPGCDAGVVGDKEKVVALASSWFDKGRRCNKYVRITGGDSGLTVTARVVGECDSSLGCDGDVVDASRAVWMGLKVDSEDWGQRRLHVTWTDA